MNIPEILCMWIVTVIIITGGAYASWKRIRYATFTNELKRNGQYRDWSKKIGTLLLLEKIAVYGAIVSLLGVIFNGMFNIEHLSATLFVCFIVFGFLGVIVSLVLYSKVPKKDKGNLGRD